jgi:hypothetical protein
MAGTIVADTLQDGAGNSTAMDNAIYGSAKSWVRFNGVSSVSIAASYNVSSITRTGTGTYTYSFSNALTDANYAVVASSSGDGSNAGNIIIPFNASMTTTNSTTAPTSSGFVFSTANQTTSSTARDGQYISIVVLR